MSRGIIERITPLVNSFDTRTRTEVEGADPQTESLSSFGRKP